MLVISSKEFREKPITYFNQADKGIEILIRRGKNKSYKLVPTLKDDTLMSKEDFFAKIDRALQEAKEGKGIIINTKDELNAYFDSL